MHCQPWQSLVRDSRQSLFLSSCKRVSLRLSAALLTVGDDAVRILPAPHVELRIPGTGKLRFIEAKGRVNSPGSVTVPKNEILTGQNKPDGFILAIGVIDGDNVELRFLRWPFQREPDFGATSVNNELSALLAVAEEPA